MSCSNFVQTDGHGTNMLCPRLTLLCSFYLLCLRGAHLCIWYSRGVRHVNLPVCLTINLGRKAIYCIRLNYGRMIGCPCERYWCVVENECSMLWDLELRCSRWLNANNAGDMQREVQCKNAVCNDRSIKLIFNNNVYPNGENYLVREIRLYS